MAQSNLDFYVPTQTMDAFHQSIDALLPRPVRVSRLPGVVEFDMDSVGQALPGVDPDTRELVIEGLKTVQFAVVDTTPTSVMGESSDIATVGVTLLSEQQVNEGRGPWIRAELHRPSGIGRRHLNRGLYTMIGPPDSDGVSCYKQMWIARPVSDTDSESLNGTRFARRGGQLYPALSIVSSLTRALKTIER